MAIRSLETPRLLLREIQLQDWKALHDCAAIRMIEDAYLQHDSRPLSRVYVEQAISERKRVPRRRFEFAVVLKESRKVVGACSLKLCRSILLEADLGYIIHPNYWNQGFATEAAQLLVHLAFHELNVFRITAHCEESNPASVQILKKIGLAAVGNVGDRLLFAKLKQMPMGAKALSAHPNQAHNTKP